MNSSSLKKGRLFSICRNRTMKMLKKKFRKNNRYNIVMIIFLFNGIII